MTDVALQAAIRRLRETAEIAPESTLISDVKLVLDALQAAKQLTGPQEPVSSTDQFVRDLANVINSHNREAEAHDTPDFILAEFLAFSLAALSAAIRKREISLSSTDGLNDIMANTARFMHLKDIYHALDIQWGQDPFARIADLKVGIRKVQCLACQEGDPLMNTDPLYPGWKPGDPSPPDLCAAHNAKGKHHIRWNGYKNVAVLCGSEECNTLVRSGRVRGEIHDHR